VGVDDVGAARQAQQQGQRAGVGRRRLALGGDLVQTDALPSGELSPEQGGAGASDVDGVPLPVEPFDEVEDLARHARVQRLRRDQKAPGCSHRKILCFLLHKRPATSHGEI
jgi:hypothetical protein